MDSLLRRLTNYNYIYITSDTFILSTIKKLFFNLNDTDVSILVVLIKYVLEYISGKYYINDIEQWTKNDGLDIKSLVLLLLPFVKKYDFYRLDNIIINGNYNNDKFKSSPLNKVINNELEYSNFYISAGNIDIYNIIENNFHSLIDTINQTNGKMFVNWLNILPINEYQKSKIFKKSISDLQKIKNGKFNNLNGLYIGDYYDVYFNGYYQSVKKIKWMIYNRRINNDYYYYIQYLTRMLNFNTFYKYNKFDNLPDNYKTEFTVEFLNIATQLENKNYIYRDYRYEFDLMKTLLSFVVNNAPNKFLIDNDVWNNFIIRDFENISDDKQEKKIDNISDDVVIESIRKINIDIVWDYIKSCIEYLKQTVYGKYLIKSKRINNNFFNLKLNIYSDGKYKNTKYKINLKNIYNIAKIMSNNNKFNLLPPKFNGLSERYKNRFFTQYLGNNNWINIGNNVNKQEDGRNVNRVIDSIKNSWDKIKVYLVFEYLVYNGILSEFKVNHKLTNDMYLPKNTKKKRCVIQSRLEEFFKNNSIVNSNYFLTNNTYESLYKYNKEIDKDTRYYKDLSDKFVHYTFYGMDWVSQLNIFNRYINHQVLYITGGTGTGKSTQVPKLILYMVKMYDYKNNGKAVCTQPRIDPTEGNAKWVSQEMGVPIMVNNYKTDNYYLQYKHSNDSHTKDNCSHLTLKFVTDGSLLEELVNNPVMKKKIKMNKNDYIYSNDNIYDVVMVDEAHEHNSNMDVILTLMRQSCIINNNVRLVIISATMDDDEPIYRSYYKYINDNLLHPIKQELYNYNLNNNYFINNIYTDRRVHISIPGQTTQYKINEYYKPFELTNDTREDSIKAQEHSYKIIENICKETDKGDILLFLTGSREIIKAVEHLNKVLPREVITLPFFSMLHPKYRDIVVNIDKNIGKIRNKRENIHKEWSPKFYQPEDVPENTYKRAVIVATNVAEASITIDTLRFVVDTGYEKVAGYDDSTLSTSLNIELISESSRVQRKGRVGRTNNGDVYYIYAKGARSLIKPKYKIANDDFHMMFIKLCYDKKSYKTILEDWSLYLKDNPKKPNKDSYFYKTKLHYVLLRQYFPEGEFNLDKYFINNRNEILPFLNRTNTGFFTKTLYDLEGKFHIVHPFENIITRNVYGDIIKINNSYKSKLNKDIWENQNKLMTFNLEYFPNLQKTIMANKINDMIRVFDNILDTESKTFIAAYCMGIMIEVCEIKSFIMAIGNNVYNLINGADKYENRNKLKMMFTVKSDLMFYHEIAKLLRTKFNKLLLYQLYDSWFSGKDVYVKYYIKYEKLIDIYMKQKMTVKNIHPELVDDWDLFNRLNNNGMLNKRGFFIWLQLSKILLNEINKELEQVYTYCAKLNFNIDVIKNYYKQLIKYVLSIITQIKEDEFSETIFEWLDSIKSGFNKYGDNISDKITIAFIFGKTTNIALKIGDEYKSLLNFKNVITSNSLINLSNVIFYHDYNITNNKIYNYINISPILLGKILPHMYNNNIFNNNKIVNKQLFRVDDINFDMFVSEINKGKNISYFPLLNSVEMPTIFEYIHKYL